jgi:uncharacterized protein (DUF488 family)
MDWTGVTPHYTRGMPDGSVPNLLSIGYGDRPWADFLDRLQQHGVEFIVDVRSRPGSRQPEYNREAIEALLGKHGIRYVFMGDLLGGQPGDPDCYVDGKVDYVRCESKGFFQDGLARIVAANASGRRVALMCSELDPERCHRSKLIGEALRRLNIPIWHIDRDGSLATHREVMTRLTGGQEPLFEQVWMSRGRYRVE